MWDFSPSKKKYPAHLAYYICEERRSVQTLGLVEAQFRYCILAWMFHGRELNRNIIYMKDMYTLPIEITIALSRIYLRRISLPVFTMETSRVWPLKSERKPFQYNNQ